MKVVHFSVALNRSAGGLPHSAAGLAAGQRLAGADVEVHGGMADFDEAERQIWGDTRLVTYPSLEGSYGLSMEMIRGVLDARPDIVHIHGIWSASSILGRFTTFRGIATVVAPHGMLEPWILSRSPIKKAVHAFLFERPLLRRCAVHALSSAEELSVRAFMAPDPVHVFMEPNGVDPIEAPVIATRKGMLFLGRMHEKKQVITLIEHWRRSAMLRDTTLTIAGGGIEPYVRTVVAAAEGAPNIHYVGPVFGTSKQDLFAKARFFILPSFSEGMPMAVLEAMAAGCVPIITRECNLPSLCEFGCALELAADFSNFDAVVAAAIAMSASEVEARSALARALAADYNWDKIARMMLSHYAELLAAPPPGVIRQRPEAT